jgi:SsrA-binding protein
MAEGIQIVTTNRKARHDYHIEDTFEAGMVLSGGEVKSIRQGKVNLQDAYCAVENGEVILHNCHITPYTHGSVYEPPDPVRNRKLLLHRREIDRLRKATEQKGFTIVPLKIYFKNGYAKAEIGLARGKKLYDKRADIAEQETKRRLERVMRGGKPTD